MHELFVITGKLDDVSSVDINMLNHVLSNWSLNNRVSDNDFKYEHDYSKVHITNTFNGWDYVRDHYRVEYGQTLVLYPKIVLQELYKQLVKKLIHIII